eukprot:c1083_g1_i1.p1 GENE.c1083_g1_i1~~c1083_g1_i1.p1  ORF type:complete len:325 (+),score=28.97 c1083_g1_i1:38-1012(+)
MESTPNHTALLVTQIRDEVDCLCFITTTFMTPLINCGPSPILSRDEVSQIFPLFDALQKWNEGFLVALSDASPQGPTVVASRIAHFAAQSDCYVRFAEQLDTSVDVLNQHYRHNRSFVSFCRGVMEVHGRGARIESHLAKRLQHLPAVASTIEEWINSLATKSLSKFPSSSTSLASFQIPASSSHSQPRVSSTTSQQGSTTQTHFRTLSPSPTSFSAPLSDSEYVLAVLSRALSLLRRSCRNMSAVMHAAEQRRKLSAIQSQFLGSIKLLRPGRALIREGRLMRLGKQLPADSSWLRVFLFNDVLVYGTVSLNGISLVPIISIE